jgi:uncharacterized protein (TIGR00255 family)
MTGFGRASFAVEGAGFDLEIRSVNHRYLDVRLRLPRLLAGFEAEVRTRVQSRFDRGKVDVVVQQPATTAPAPRLELDFEVAGRYLEAAEALRQRYAVEGRLDVDELLALPGVARLGEAEFSDADLGRELLASLDAALAAADAMRRSEGEALEREVLGRLARVEALGDQVSERSGLIQEQVRERLRKRSEKLARETGLMDEARLYQELVIAADRLDVTEELVRLKSHIEQFRAGLAGADAGAPVGRRLDFLLQELGREVNTVGSKGADAPVAHLVVELKTELERIREQVQNVE